LLEKWLILLQEGGISHEENDMEEVCHEKDTTFDNARRALEFDAGQFCACE
jgi:hypothetical protein